MMSFDRFESPSNDFLDKGDRRLQLIDFGKLLTSDKDLDIFSRSHRNIDTACDHLPNLSIEQRGLERLEKLCDAFLEELSDFMGSEHPTNRPVDVGPASSGSDVTSLTNSASTGSGDSTVPPSAPGNNSATGASDSQSVASTTDNTNKIPAEVTSAGVAGGWQADFTNPGSAKSTLDKFAPVQWGNVAVNPNGGIDVSAVPGKPNVAQSGFMQTDHSASDGNGYGKYTMTFSAVSQGGDGGATNGQGSGVYACLWPASNVWPGPEIDSFENWNGQLVATQHWKGADGSNQYQTHNIEGIDPTKPFTVTMDWKPDANGTPTMTEYINQGGVNAAVPKLVYTSKTNVPADFAHGGENLSWGLGAESSAPNGNAGSRATVYGMGYSPY